MNALFGMRVIESGYLPAYRRVSARSGDARNPFPAFGLRPRKVRESIDVVIVAPDGRTAYVSPRVVGLVTNLPSQP